jgi:hypothetical protein
MNHRIAVGASLAFALLGCAVAGEPLKSGPQVGSSQLVPFHPLNVTGSAAGTKLCQV